FAERDHRPSLPCASRHSQQYFTVQIALKCFTYSPYRPRLIVAFDNGFVDFGVGETLPSFASLNEQFQLCLLVKPLHRPRRIAQVVPYPMVVAVGVEDYRPLAKLFLQTVRVQFCLLLPSP